MKLSPQKEEEPDFFTAKGYKTIIFSTKFGYKSEEMDGERHGGIQYHFIDWKPLIKLGEPHKVENVLYEQKIIGEIKAGDLLGGLLPKAPDFEFIDFANNEKFYENPGQFQEMLLITDFFDDFSKPTSSLDKTLKLGEKNQEISVFIWPGNQKTAHEQQN